MKALMAILLVTTTFLCIEFAQVKLGPLESLAGRWMFIFSFLVPLCIAGAALILLRPFWDSRFGRPATANENQPLRVGLKRKRVAVVAVLFATFIVGVHLARELAAEITVDGQLIKTQSQQLEIEKRLGFRLVVQQFPHSQKWIFLRGEGREAKVVSVLAEYHRTNATKGP